MKAKVYYWKDIKSGWILGGIPTLDQFLRDYALLIEFDMPLEYNEHNTEQACEWVFEELNLRPENLIPNLPELPKELNHTSMSVGDIVSFFGHNYSYSYICASVGFDKLP